MLRFAQHDKNGKFLHTKYPFGYAQDKLSRLNRFGKTIRLFEEVFRSSAYYAFENMIYNYKVKVKS